MCERDLKPDKFNCPGTCAKYGWVLEEPVRVTIEAHRFISQTIKCVVREGQICMATNTAIVSPNAATCVDRKNRPSPERCPYL